MKRCLIVPLLMFFAVCSRAQTVAFNDMANMTTLSIGQVDNILMSTGKFKINSKEIINGQIINKYQTINNNKQVIKGETVIAGAFRTAGDGSKLRTLTYYTIYPAYVQNLMKQITRFGYKMIFQGSDNKQLMYLYENPLNHVTVCFKHDHSICSVEIRQKDIDME